MNKFLDDDRRAQEEKDERIAGLVERLQQQQDKSKEVEKIFEYLIDLNRMDVAYNPVEGDWIDGQLAEIFSHHN